MTDTATEVFEVPIILLPTTEQMT